MSEEVLQISEVKLGKRIHVLATPLELKRGEQVRVIWEGRNCLLKKEPRT